MPLVTRKAAPRNVHRESVVHTNSEEKCSEFIKGEIVNSLDS